MGGLVVYGGCDVFGVFFVVEVVFFVYWIVVGDLVMGWELNVFDFELVVY